MIHTVPLVRYIGKRTDGLQKMQEEFDMEIEGVTIPTQVLWLGNSYTIRERRQIGEIGTSSVVIVVMGSKMAKGMVKKRIKGGGVWYAVETYTNACPDSRCELCCGWGHIENKCGSKPTCGYCSIHERTSDHKSNVVGCKIQQGSLYGHILEKYPNCNGNHNALSNRCATKAKAAKAARQSRGIGPAWRASVNAATGVASGTKRVVLGHRPNGTATEEGGSEAELVDAEEEKAMGEAENVTITQRATTATTNTETETETGALATNDVTDSAQLH